MLSKSDYAKLSKSGKKKVKKVSGNGAYMFDKVTQPYGHMGEKIGKYVAPFLGKYGPAARYVGALGGHLIGRMRGSGAYRPKYRSKYQGQHNMFIKGSGAYDIPAPSNVMTNQNSPPSFGTNRTIVRHREFIQNVLSSTTFALTKFDLNPGVETTFPWLSGIAANYEKYRPCGMIFEFKSTSANALNSTNTALGTVMMAARYNAISQNIPQSKMEMLQIENCTSICPAESALCGIECARQFNPLDTLYIRLGSNFNVPNGAEQFYDFADFYIATEGMQTSAVNIGELWVTYEIELLTPVLASGQVGDNVNFAGFYGTSTIATFPLGSNTSAFTINTFNPTISQSTGKIFVSFPVGMQTGTYSWFYSCKGASTSNVAGLVPGDYTNCEASPIMENGTVATLRTFLSGGSASDYVYATGYVNIIGNGQASFSLSGGTLPGTATMAQLILQQIPDQNTL